MPTVHIDSTGNVIQTPKGCNKKAYYYAGVIQIPQNKRVVAVLEQYTESHDAGSIGLWLGKFRVNCLQIYKKWPIFSKVIIDFSYAFINAISIFWNDMPFLTYLNATFKQVLMGGKDYNYLSNVITIHLCICHFSKIMSSDINKCFKENKSVIKSLLTITFNLKNFNHFISWFKNMCVVLNSPYKTDQLKLALSALQEQYMKGKGLKEAEDERMKDFEFYDDHTALYKSSPFYQYFCEIRDKVHLDEGNNQRDSNTYYSPEFFKILLEKYIPILPLWSGILTDGNHVSNAPVERWFDVVKNLILEGVKKQKCSRVVRRIRSHVLSIHKEATLKISSKRCATKPKPVSVSQEDSGLLSYEKWEKRIKSPVCNLKKSRLQSILSLNKNVVNPYNTSDDDFMRCIYCHRGKLNISADWVQCDKCKSWIHQVCYSEKGNRSFSGDFLCKFCNDAPIAKAIREIDKSKADHENSLSTLCKNYMAMNELSDEQIKEIAKKSVKQRHCKLWQVERAKRLTASQFGPLLKSRTAEVLGKKLQKILIPDTKRLQNVKAIQYGNENESRALEKYKKINPSFTIELSGLIIHPDFQFLACSPDGLVNNDGLVEIKCPISVKDMTPQKALEQNKIPYLSKSGYLKTGHDYYYQIQGQLEITNRSWCDLVVYTPKNIYVKKIKRHRNFWQTHMFPKLRDIFYYHLLPEIVDPKGFITRRIYKNYRNDMLLFQQNGLISNVNYYVSIPGKDYVIGTYGTVNCPIKEIYYGDYDTLNGNNWLSNFLIDICLEIINIDNGNKFQIFSTEISTNIFVNNAFTYDTNSQISKERLIFPIWINRNHFCLIYVDITKKELIFINPQQETEEDSNYYLKQFLNFIEHYNASPSIRNISKASWRAKRVNHLTQTDGYNCGIFVIYFFKQIATNKSLCVSQNPQNYRQTLKSYLIEKSDSVLDKCLFCGTDNTRNMMTYKCVMCLRTMHSWCLGDQLETALKKNQICYLCTSYAEI